MAGMVRRVRGFDHEGVRAFEHPCTVAISRRWRPAAVDRRCTATTSRGRAGRGRSRPPRGRAGCGRPSRRSRSTRSRRCRRGRRRRRTCGAAPRQGRNRPSSPTFVAAREVAGARDVSRPGVDRLVVAAEAVGVAGVEDDVGGGRGRRPTSARRSVGHGRGVNDAAWPDSRLRLQRAVVRAQPAVQQRGVVPGDPQQPDQPGRDHAAGVVVGDAPDRRRRCPVRPCPRRTPQDPAAGGGPVRGRLSRPASGRGRRRPRRAGAPRRRPHAPSGRRGTSGRRRGRRTPGGPATRRDRRREGARHDPTRRPSETTLRDMAQRGRPRLGPP